MLNPGFASSLFSGFLDKNNDLLYRHLKEVQCVYSVSVMNIYLLLNPVYLIAGDVSIKETHPESVFPCRRVDGPEKTRDG